MNAEKETALRCAWDAHTPMHKVVQFCRNIGTTVSPEDADAFYTAREREAVAAVDHEAEAREEAATLARRRAHLEDIFHDAKVQS